MYHTYICINISVISTILKFYTYLNVSCYTIISKWFLFGKQIFNEFLALKFPVVSSSIASVALSSSYILWSLKKIHYFALPFNMPHVVSFETRRHLNFAKRVLCEHLKCMQQATTSATQFNAPQRHLVCRAQVIE